MQVLVDIWYHAACDTRFYRLDMERRFMKRSKQCCRCGAPGAERTVIQVPRGHEPRKNWYRNDMQMFLIGRRAAWSPDMRWVVRLGLLASLLLTACRSNVAEQRTEPRTVLRRAGVNVQVPEGWKAEVYAEGLRSPTALAWGPDGKLYATQLNGGENAGTGQVVVIDQPGAVPVPVLDNVRKPTGLAWREQAIYVVAGREVLRTRLAGATLAPPEVVVPELPFNGRSEGQVDLLPDGRLVFETSGSVGNPRSGQVLTLGTGDQPATFATGLKNAYGYAYDASTKRLYATEIGDDRMDGKPPPEEINLIEVDGDYGWPRCYGDRIPARDRGADEAACSTTRTPLVTFPSGSTPTGLAFYDREDVPSAYRRALYVALWNGTPTVQRIAITETAEGMRGEATTFMSGAGRPIDILTHPEGGLLVLDFEHGVIYLVRATSA